MIDVAIMTSLPDRRARLEEIVRAEPAFHVAGIAPTFPYLRSLLDETSVHVVIIDFAGEPASEIKHEWLSELINNVTVVVLASAADATIFNTLLGADHGGLLRTEATGEQIVRAVQSAAAGLLTLDSTIVPQPEQPEDMDEALTPRETEVLRLLAEGFSNREIAARLEISEHTIKFHIGSILGKLGASTRTEAVTRGLRSGLIEL